MRGSIAKEKVIQKLKDTFGSDYIGEDNKKYYVWEDDGGERVQIAIALTCPKNMIEVAPAGAWTAVEAVDITADERAQIEELLKLVK